MSSAESQMENCMQMVNRRWDALRMFWLGWQQTFRLHWTSLWYPSIHASSDGSLFYAYYSYKLFSNNSLLLQPPVRVTNATSLVRCCCNAVLLQCSGVARYSYSESVFVYEGMKTVLLPWLSTTNVWYFHVGCCTSASVDLQPSKGHTAIPGPLKPLEYVHYMPWSAILNTAASRS